MHDVAWYCAMNYVRSRDAQKQLARTPLKSRKAPLTGWQVGWSKDIRNPYYSFRNPGNFSFTNHIGLVCMHNFCQASTLGFQDSGMEIFACGIRNLGIFFLGFGIRNSAQGIRAPANDWNPEPIFRWHGTKNYLKLHGAKKDVLLLKWCGLFCQFTSLVSIRIHELVAAWDHAQTLPFKGQVLAETRLNDQRFQRKTMAWFEFLILAGFRRFFLRRQVI